MRLGILGGTFDPIHNGHLIIARKALVDFGLSRIFLVPAGDPWRKKPKAITPGAHRLSMIKLAVEEEDCLEVSSIELDREGPSYTETTLLELRSKYGKETELYFIIGEDSLRELHLWKSPDRILSLARLVIAPRFEETKVDLGLLNNIKSEGAKLGFVLDVPKIPVSSTEIRAKVASNAYIGDLVPGKVEDYILSNGLYSSSEK